MLWGVKAGERGGGEGKKNNNKNKSKRKKLGSPYLIKKEMGEGW